MIFSEYTTLEQIEKILKLQGFTFGRWIKNRCEYEKKIIVYDLDR